ncbi:hypothetical protein CCR94_07065 [Rhodoblastus sphagnicola]|uniref:Uncharacterized protein n=1 Tax=Rhodoblastus sphagnicola TaxID=333368 RepID=A0A2S6NC27_9HYPH|nr:hypothetical protein [Rhodoblastus sphagnicola]MBB4197467.1 hypothetical protein [Rhodoblastus sphagnicola]PPQ32170.1 hypothetical protein CCR94_07065 [Rhodoblastus sphagnicola]
MPARTSFALGLLLAGTLAAAAQTPANDFPTEARADYVFACMAANGQTPDALRKCACSIDMVASILPYDRYVEAETVLSMRQGLGRKASMFRAANFEDMVADLRRAQAEGEIRCFY